MAKEVLISLHSHTNRSYQDALSTSEDLFEYAKLYNAPSMGMSDHHNLCSWPEFYKIGKKAGIKPICSVEFYFQWQDKIATEKQSYHLLVTVLNEAGWRNILKLTYLSNLTPDQGGGFYGRPRISEKMLYAHQEGLSVSSACVSGPVAKPLLSGNDMEARMAAEEFRDNLKFFWIEVMPHNLPIQAKVNAKLFQIGKDLGIPVITTLDIHFKDKSYENAYICNGDMRRNVTSIERANPDLDCLRDPDFYYKSLPEIYSIFDSHGCSKSDVEESIRNTNVIDCMCTFDWERKHFDQPRFCDDADEVLRQLSWKRLKEKFGGSNNIPQAYIDRIKVEYNVVKDMGFSNYFLILNDAIDFCNGSNILVGPGRGSAASSLLLWTLGITALDPLLYNLPFERFLNKDRVDTFPDVDVDLDSKGRETLLAYLKSKWGEDKVVQLINFSSMKPKAALKDVGKWLQVGGSDYFKIVNDITTQIPAKTYDEDGNAVEMEFDEVVKLPQMQKYRHDYPQLFEIASKLIGSYRQPGIHAGAMCILPENAQEIIPTMRREGRLISQWDKKMSELVGIHKYDFLGLSTLMILDECEKMTGIKCGDISLEDKKTWKFLQEARYMLGIFQFAKDKTKGFLRKIKPTRLQDLSDINTIIRPGADADLYIENRNSGITTYKFGYPEVIESLRNSYGSIIYQEDIMYLVHRLAGFTLGEGDMLRRALEKNKKADIDVWRARFKEACKYPDKADELFDWIGANAAYLFNRSHALTYSLIGYWCSFYKANYPEAFLVANLRHPKGNAEYSEPEYIQAFIQEAREMGVYVELPRLGNCYPVTTLVDKTVYYGLTGIKGISESSASPLASITADNFADFGVESAKIKKEHLVNGKIQSRALVNKAHIRQLVKIGFFGDPGEIIQEFNKIYKEEVTVESYEDAVNDAVGFNWFSPLEKYYERLETRYRDKDNYMLMKVTSKKPGQTNGRDWCMIKGETIMGQITVFLEKPSQGSSIKAKDIVIASYKRNPKKDSITFIDMKLLD